MASASLSANGQATGDSLTPRHHAGEETLLAYAVGALPPGASLVVSAHLEACPDCTDETRFLESVGTAVLLSAEPAPLRAGVLDRVMAQIATTPDKRRPAPSPDAWPRALSGHRIGMWRWAGPGLRLAPVKGAGGSDERVYLLRAQAGVKLPQHTHRGGCERVLVLSGALVDGERYEPGDLCETAHDGHEPVAGPDGPCLCLVATDHRLRFNGPARWLQPFLGV